MRIYDSSKRFYIESDRYPLIDPESIRKALVDAFARPWRYPMNPAERDGYTRAVYCSSGRATGSYRAERWRALERSLSSSTGWAYRYFDAVPSIGRACGTGDASAVTRAIREQSDENRRRAQQWVQLTSDIGQIVSNLNAAVSSGTGTSIGIPGTSADEPEQDTPPARPIRPVSAVRESVQDKLRKKLQTSPMGVRFSRRIEAADFTGDLRNTIRERLQAAGQSPTDAAASADAVVQEAVTAQAETVAAGAGLSPEWQALLDAAYPLASAERYAELFPSLPLEVQNLIKQYSNTFQAIGLE